MSGSAPHVEKKKKRGRRPRGGKVVGAPGIVAEPADVSRNVILHFSCMTSDVVSTSAGSCSDAFDSVGSTVTAQAVPGSTCAQKPDNDLWAKLRTLNDTLHRGTGLGKSSDCFWCTCGFSTPPIHIPRSVQPDSTIECYGCFCTPECAMAYLLKERVDSSQMWERVALLNTVYGAVFGHSRSIRPAPDPHYFWTSTTAR
jgi:hypothetical protein